MHLKALILHHRLFLALPVTESLVLSPDLMPKSLIADPSLIEIERPPCPKCHGPMTLTGVVSRPGGLDVRTFECALCNCTEKVSVEIGST
jgi:hypothetical protein